MCALSPPAPSILDYHSEVPTFALSISPLSTSSPASLRLAVGSYNEQRISGAAPSASSSSQGGAQPNPATYTNNFTVAALDPAVLDLDDASDSDSETAWRSRSTRQRVQGGPAFQAIARAPLLYPPSAVQFAPARLSSSLAAGAGGQGGGEQREVVATSSECLRLWDLVSEPEDGAGGRNGGFVGSGAQPSRSKLVSRATLVNSKADYSAPLTSFSWSLLEPTHIVTSSIDTTCTVWDISTGLPITQLIAHDREVYDVAWSPSSRDIFTSVGADGSVRMFDLRSLEHSTILYEAAPASASSSASSSSKRNGASSSASPSSNSPPPPLLRVAFSPTSPTYLSVVHADSADVQILDTRSPGTPAFVVSGHKAPVNGLAWGGETMAMGGGETSGPGWMATVSDDATLLLWDLTTASPPPSAARGVQQQPKRIETPALAYTAPSEINALAWGGGGDWVSVGCGRVVRTLSAFSEGCPIYSPFFGVMGCTAAIVFTCIGASYGTSKSGVGIAAMGVLRPDLMMKCIIPVVMAGIIAIYGLVVSVLISGGLTSPMPLYTGFIQLGAGLSVGLAGLAAGFAIGIVGDAGVRGVAQQSRVFVGMILILIFAEVLGLYGLIVALIMNTRANDAPEC
ncbi:hypothetical protein JCM10207_001269 [Rhodosporidiobolus poonsookiae]